LLCAALAATAGLWLTGAALAHDEAAGHDPARADWFESLKRPGTDASCCNLTDCRRTEARQLADGSWRALVDGLHGPTWMDVPPAKVLERPLSIDGEAYVCHRPALAGGKVEIPGLGGGGFYDQSPREAEILCFVPPIPGF
jgi:hypothetical protein